MADTKREQLIDPVCGMHIDPEQAPAVLTYGERSYYFCSDTHRDQFARNPEPYVRLARQEEGEAAA